MISWMVTKTGSTPAGGSTRGRIELRFAVRPHLERIAVTDHVQAMPRPGGDDLDSEHGRGLLIVERMASRWGSDRLATGKRVWFELDH